MTVPAEGSLDVSLARDDLPFRIMRRIGLAPAQGLGTVRRAACFSLLSWLPIALWAAVSPRAAVPANGESLASHFAVHVMGLVAIPLMILAQGGAHRLLGELLPWFVRSGTVPEDRRGAFDEAVRGVRRLRDATLPWIILLSFVAAWTVLRDVVAHDEPMAWASGGSDRSPRLGFGGLWVLYVLRPVYLTLALSWLWRVVLVTVLMRRLANLGLRLAPTHPDRVGGIGFVEHSVKIFVPVVLACSTVVASQWAHQILYHDGSIASFRYAAILFTILAVLVFLVPVFPFLGPLVAAKRRGIREYGALVAQQAHLVHRRWIDGVAQEDAALLSAPEIGPIADANAMYEAVQGMKALPIGKGPVLALVVAAAAPLLAVAALEVPMADLLKQLLHALV